MATSADNPAVEPTIYIENVSHTREYTYRASAADGPQRFPVHATEEVWNQYQQIPLVPPALVPNAGPGAGIVELVSMVLQPVAGSTLKWGFSGWDPAYGPPSPPGPPSITNQLSRVIPATFGDQDNLPYRPTLSGAPAYDGYTWVVDGLNHYVEFPYGSPPGLTSPILAFYRYTGLTGGGAMSYPSSSYGSLSAVPWPATTSAATPAKTFLCVFDNGPDGAHYEVVSEGTVRLTCRGLYLEGAATRHAALEGCAGAVVMTIFDAGDLLVTVERSAGDPAGTLVAALPEPRFAYALRVVVELRGLGARCGRLTVSSEPPPS